jgi:phosphoglycolate phosphatase
MQPNLPKPRAVLFDWDGTVVDSFDAIHAAHNLVRSHFGLANFTSDELRQAVKIGTSREIFTHIYGPDRVQEALDLYYGAIPRLRSQNLAVCQGALEFVTALHHAHIPMGVVSNMAAAPLRDEIDHLGWASYFDVVMGAGDAPRGKPAPDAVFLAFDRLDIPRAQADQVWFVGDMETDEKAAHASGCKFLYYTAHVESPAERNRLKADLKFDRYDVVVEILKQYL